MEALILNLYFELLKTPVFTVEDVNKYYDNMDSARSAIKRLMKEGIVAKIRNNMYTCISGETGAPVANRFQIASKITPTSYVSHHTAMEYYGITDQVLRCLCCIRNQLSRVWIWWIYVSICGVKGYGRRGNACTKWWNTYHKSGTNFGRLRKGYG